MSVLCMFRPERDSLNQTAAVFSPPPSITLCLLCRCTLLSLSDNARYYLSPCLLMHTHTLTQTHTHTDTAVYLYFLLCHNAIRLHTLNLWHPKCIWRGVNFRWRKQFKIRVPSVAVCLALTTNALFYLFNLLSQLATVYFGNLVPKANFNEAGVLAISLPRMFTKRGLVQSVPRGNRTSTANGTSVFIVIVARKCLNIPSQPEAESSTMHLLQLVWFGGRGLVFCLTMAT